MLDDIFRHSLSIIAVGDAQYTPVIRPATSSLSKQCFSVWVGRSVGHSAHFCYNETRWATRRERAKK